MFRDLGAQNGITFERETERLLFRESEELTGDGFFDQVLNIFSYQASALLWGKALLSDKGRNIFSVSERDAFLFESFLQSIEFKGGNMLYSFSRERIEDDHLVESSKEFWTDLFLQFSQDFTFDIFKLLAHIFLPEFFLKADAGFSGESGGTDV